MKTSVFLSLLFLLFLGLKLADVITWSWWWVFAPLWIILPVLFILFFALGVASYIVRERQNKIKKDLGNPNSKFYRRLREKIGEK